MHRFETLTENILDLGHVPFAHHNAAGISKKRNVNPDLTVPDYGHVATGGFVIRRPAVPTARAAEYDLRLDAPGHASYVYTDPGSGFNQHFLIVPTKPGWSKLFISMVGCSDSKVRVGGWRGSPRRCMDEPSSHTEQAEQARTDTLSAARDGGEGSQLLDRALLGCRRQPRSSSSAS